MNIEQPTFQLHPTYCYIPAADYIGLKANSLNCILFLLQSVVGAVETASAYLVWLSLIGKRRTAQFPLWLSIINNQGGNFKNNRLSEKLSDKAQDIGQSFLESKHQSLQTIQSEEKRLLDQRYLSLKGSTRSDLNRWRWQSGTNGCWMLSVDTVVADKDIESSRDGGH